MEATLRVRNEDAAPIRVESDGGSVEPVVIAPSADADLGGRLLSSRSFRTLLASGKVRFIETPSPTDAQYRLARQVMPLLLKKVGGPIVALADLLGTAKESLNGKRLDYNQRHAGAVAVIQDGKDSAEAADHLYRGCNHFLNSKLEEAVVTGLEADITALEAEDLDVSGRSLQEWFAERDAKQEELQAAQAALEAAERQYVDPLAGLKQAVQEASTTFAAADPSTDVGAALPTFP